MDLNRVMLIGRLTRDPELRTITSGKSVATFSVATSRQWTDANGQKQKQSEFHNVVVWGKLAEVAGQYLKKGSQLYVEGRLQTRDWTTPEGVKKYRTEVVADSFIMLGGRPTGSGGGEALFPSGSGSTPPFPGGAQEVIEEEIKIEDIPF